MQAIHVALVAGVGVFLVVVLGLVYLNGSAGLMGYTKPDLDKIYIGIAYLFALGGSALGMAVFEKNMKYAKRFAFIKEKAMLFRTAFLIRMALHEAGAFVSIVLYMLSGNYYLLGGAAICIIAMVGARPTQDFITYKLFLSKEEGEEIAAL